MPSRKNSGSQIINMMVLVFFLFAGFTAKAQPSNDDPCNATALTVGATCVNITADNINATGSAGVPDPGCANYLGGDVWFTAVIPASGGVSVTLTSIDFADAGMAIYTGDCNNLSLLYCDDDSGDGLMPLLEVANQPVGSTIFIRVWEYGNNSFGQFGICAIEFTPPPPPANDDCAGAIGLTVNPDASCAVTTPGSTTGATPSGGVLPTCGAAGANDDVWFSFMATGPAHIISVSSISGSGDLVMQVYSGTCGAEVPMSCSDPEEMVVGGLIAGQTYLVRVFTWSSAPTTRSDFNICVGTPPPPPANDECTGSVPLTVNPDMSCAVTTTSTTRSASQSSGTPACGGTGNNDDVWFNFVATSTAHIISIQNISGTSDMVMEVFSGQCGTLVSIGCSDPEEMIVGGLTVNDTYYVRVWTWSSSLATTSDFSICVGTPPPPPANDECSGAVMLTVNPDASCAITTRGTTFSATPSNDTPPTCTITGLNDDVWYSFIATNSVHMISLDNVSGTSDMVMQVYSGSCGSGVPIACSDPESMTVTGLTPGQSYFVRVWTWSSTTSTYGEFDICVGTPPPPFGNDEPCSAELLTPGYECNYVQYNNFSATPSNVPNPTCSFYQGGDVWFKVVVPCEGGLKIDTRQGTITDGGMAIYTGSCDGSLTQIACDDDGSPNGLMPMINMNGLTPGDTIYIRFWEYGNDVAGTFDICVSIPPPPTVGTACTSAQPFCTSQTYTVPNSVDVPSLGSGGEYGCLFSTPNPAWYFLQVQTAGDIIIGISQVDGSGNGLDVDYAVWGPFSSAGDACTGISASNIISCSYSAAPTETATITNAQVGEFYMLLLTNYSNQPGTITFQQTAGTGQSSCAAICNITASNTGPVCPGKPFNLSTPGFAGAVYNWTGPRCFTSSDQNPTGVIAPEQPGTYQYFVTATDTVLNISCYGYTEVTVLPGVELGNDVTANLCPGSFIDLTSYFTTSGTTPVWTLNSNPVANPASVTSIGVYQLIATNTDGCSDTAFVTVTDDPYVFAADTSIVRCEGSNVNLTTVYNTSDVTAVYEFGGSTVADPTAVTAAGVYSLIVTTAQGCIDTVAITLNLNAVAATASATNAACGADGSITVAATGGIPPFSYEISSAPGVFQANNTFTVPAGTYSLTVRDSLGCTLSIPDVVVGVTNDLTVEVPASVTICGDNTVTITATGNSAADYQWSPAPGLNTTTGQTVIAAPQQTTTYTVTATLGNCTATADVIVNVEEPVTANAGPDIELLSGSSATINGSFTGNVASILWSPSTGLSATDVINPTVTASGTGPITYTLTVTSNGGCSASDDMVLTIIPSCIRLRNAFSPNGDGTNDLWKVYDADFCLSKVSVQVFNRYGNKVYASNDYRNTWDGTYNGSPVPDGTYYAIVQFYMSDGTMQTVRTDLTIIR